ncbi:hypothetical protein [Acetobacterium tundrae]|uniref:Uncharacterized protein n=1 Tax=Acetobacterium tundrae TaxID=132932 RepID=A0ABR6WLV7_9FIRM|nr:hypothetical protein [Acetobacterium tundrae]MBC3797155.1 hypothetical protein [Acetobacterium tundrae]
MISFVEKMQGYENDVAQAIKDKNEIIKKLEQKAADKAQEIDIKQAEYNKKPSDTLFKTLLKLKQELAALELDVKSADEIITIPPVKHVDPEEITRDIDNFIDSLKLQEFKDNIEKAKQDFYKSIDIFGEQIEKISAFKEDIASVNVDKYAVRSALEKHTELFYCYDEMDVNQGEMEVRRFKVGQCGNSAPKIY